MWSIPLALRSGLLLRALAFAALLPSHPSIGKQPLDTAPPGPAVAFGLSEIRKTAPGAPVNVAIDPSLGAEAFRIRGTAIAGGDERGAMYGALDYAEQLQLHGKAADKSERPALPIRALKFNIPLPGTGYLSEEDLANNQWFWDLSYWDRFLDMAARNRYNALTLWSAHPFDRMTRISRYPEATDLTAAELNRNIRFFRALFRMAADRGLSVYLITWNIHVSRSFARHHNIAIMGADSPLVRDYTREAIKALFTTYPELTGIGTTIGEQMPRMSDSARADWIADTYFRALREVGHPIPFILRCWQANPVEVVRMLERVKHSAPVYLDIKFNGEHMYSSSRHHVQDQRWLQFAPGHYKLLWHLRNDDFFILRWGDPDFVREAVERMGGPDSAGFIEGSELDVPGVDRIHTRQARQHLDWQYKFEKHWFRYMLWGRIGYAPAEPDDTWRAHYTRRFGAAGAAIFEATRQASKILPLVTAYHWNYMNGDWYPEGSIGSWNTAYEQVRANYRRAVMYHDIRTWVFNNTIDESLLNIPEFLSGVRGGEGPLEVAARLAGYGRQVLEIVSKVSVTRGAKEFACTKLDLAASANLGLYYAEKLRAAVELGRLLLNNDEQARPRAINHLMEAAGAWRRVVAVTESHYLPHEVWLFGTFDWKRYTPDVLGDIQIVRQSRPYLTTYAEEGLHTWLEYVSRLRGRPVPPPPAGRTVRVADTNAASVTAPMKLEGDHLVAGAQPTPASGNSIASEHDFGAANSATFLVDVPEDGDYSLRAACLPPAAATAGPLFTILVDESNTPLGGRRNPVRAPQTTAGTRPQVVETLQIGAGRHTVRFIGRQPGAKLVSFELIPVPER